MGDGEYERLQRLGDKLERLHDRFQRGTVASLTADDATVIIPSSFSAHLKSQREFGNPHLLKTIIDHFQIHPLRSHGGTSFKGFEYADRLMAAEERARIAQATNYDAGNGGVKHMGGVPGPGTFT